MTGEDNKSTDDKTIKTTTEAIDKPNKALESSPTTANTDASLDQTIADGNADKTTSKSNVTDKKDSPAPSKSTIDKEIKKAMPPSKATAPDKTKVSESPQKTSKLGSIALIILLLLIIGLVAGGFFGFRFWQDYSSQQEQRLSSIESENNEQLSKIEALSQEQANKNSDQAEFLNTIKKDQDALQTQINQRLDSHTERLRALAGTSRNDWLLAEARYLLRLASQRLLVENSTVGAQALLQSADDILINIDDAELMPTRSAIAAEMIALRLAKAVDRPGIYLQLSALKDEIQALPLIPFRPKSESINVEMSIADDTSNKWYSQAIASLNKVLAELKSFVQVRQHDQAPDLLISEQLQLQTINNLMLMLEQAQYSLLHEEELIYQSSLKKAQIWWKSYYSHYSEYEVINHEINKLLNKEIVQKIPTINRSTKLLTDYIDQFHKLNDENKSTTKEPTPESITNTATQEKAL
jgi:uroporphyrin-3 C-methyltransferase